MTFYTEGGDYKSVLRGKDKVNPAILRGDLEIFMLDFYAYDEYRLRKHFDDEEEVEASDEASEDKYNDGLSDPDSDGADDSDDDSKKEDENDEEEDEMDEGMMGYHEEDEMDEARGHHGKRHHEEDDDEEEDEEDEDKRKPRLHCVPMKQETNEIIVAAFICAYSIFFISIMITIESLKKKIYCIDADADESFEIKENRCFKYIGWPLQLARLICATLFHVGFQ